MDILSCTAQQWAENEESFLKQLQDDAFLSKIPLLNANDFHNLENKLVRFRGMIQDMHSPEFYLEKFEVVNSKTQQKNICNGKYCEDTPTNEHENLVSFSKANIRSERHPYSVISIPGLNNWVKDIEEQQFKLVENVQTCERMDTVENSTCGTSSNFSKDFILNFPLPNPKGKVCLLKVYKDNNDLKLNDVCEFVGFLNLVEPCQDEKNSLVVAVETEDLNSPTSLIPRIHCVHFVKLKHNNPLVVVNENLEENWNLLKKELSIALTQLLLGDKLAAQFLIYHLISSIYQRREFMALGNFALNISNVPVNELPNYVEELYKFIEMLVPKSYYLPMTLENMNDLTFVPQKDYDYDRLTSGLLQLSNNTHVILDETKLTSGKLNSSGVENVKTLRSTIRDQQISYKFNFYNIDFECDIPFLILSEGKSMVNSDIQIVLKPEASCIETFPAILEAAGHFFKPELLNKIRKYLTLARLTQIEITNNVEGLIEKEFVKMRQEDNITGDDLHRLLVLSKLVCVSQGKTTLDEEAWNEACALEKERKARIGH